jgi:ubiquinone/menaquinone biosynthesis C-methylase UbiE
LKAITAAIDKYPLEASPMLPLDFDQLSRSSLGFYRVWTIHLGRRYGILGAIAKSNGLTMDELARETKLFPKGLKLWCDAACSLGIIARRDGGYRLAGRMKDLLVNETHKEYLGGQLSYLALRSLDYDAFDGFFRDGTVPESAPPHIVEAFKEATRWDHTGFLRIVLREAPQVKSILEGRAKVLDVGSGTGDWISRMRESYPLPLYVGVESDSVAIKRAMDRAVAAGPASVRFEHGTAESMPYDDEFDLVYLGEVLCVMLQRKQALAKCFEALKPGGILVVAEGLLDEKKGWRGASNELMRPMQLDFALLGGSFFSRAELRRLLQDTGFMGLRFLSAGGGFWFAVARKPSTR